MKRLLCLVMMNCVGQELSQCDSDVQASLSQRQEVTSVSTPKSSVNVCAILSIIFCVGGVIAGICAFWLSAAISLSTAGGFLGGGIAFLVMACVDNKKTATSTSTATSVTHALPSVTKPVSSSVTSTVSSTTSSVGYMQSEAPLRQSENLISFFLKDNSIIYDDDMKEISPITYLDESKSDPDDYALFNNYPLRVFSEIID